MTKINDKILKELREIRGFNVKEYCPVKISAINDFFESEKLDSVVLGLSGGVDSAVTLALLIEASKVENSPIKKIVGLAMPIYGIGSTGQDEATERAKHLEAMYASHDKFEFRKCDLTLPYNEYLSALQNEHDGFAAGQLLSIVRMPFLYFNAAILQTKGYYSIVSGTTNRDEGGYIGFFGKASDAMVDLQVIGDLHKSEVYKIAKHYNLPAVIIEIEPKGDVYDGRTDQQMIGATYDQVELFTLLKDYSESFKELNQFLTDPAFLNIEALHSKNAHKYKVGMPSRFVDVLKRKVQGGWQ